MPFQNLQKDVVHIEKLDGSVTGPFKTAVTSDSATIFDATLDVTEGEKLIRKLPNAKDESYLILSANFSQGLGGIPPHYTLKLRKTTAINPSPAVRHTTVTINNSTGVTVGDHNMINIQNAVNELVREIDSADASSQEKSEAKSRIAAMLAHPLVGSILGGVAGALTNQIGS
jgi:hypothetical protein